LTTEEKMKEIARLLGGEKITKKALEHAQELLKQLDESIPSPALRAPSPTSAGRRLPVNGH
jgi:hypothetical protein